jgi:hypothetical protein
MDALCAGDDGAALADGTTNGAASNATITPTAVTNFRISTSHQINRFGEYTESAAGMTRE